MAKLFVSLLLTGLLSLATTNPIIVPSPPQQHLNHGQFFVPALPQQLQHYLQQRLADRSDYLIHQQQQQQQQQHDFQQYRPESAISDYGSAYGDYQQQATASNNVNPEDDEGQDQYRQTIHDFVDHNHHHYQQQHQPQSQDYSGYLNFNSVSGEPESNFESVKQDAYPGVQTQHVHTEPVSEHVEVTKPVIIPRVKEIGVPVPYVHRIAVPHPVAVGVPQPYPVTVPVARYVPINIVKTVAVPREKKIPVPIERVIPVPIIRPYKIEIEKQIAVPIYKPYPIKVPVYKTVYHRAKKHRHSPDDDDDDDD